jgi:hypothetical protein
VVAEDVWGLDLLAYESFDGATVQRLPAWRANLPSPLPTHQDLPNLVRVEHHQVERLCASIGSLGRVMLDSYEAREPVVLYYLAGDTLGRVGDEIPRLLASFRAGHHRGVLYFVRQ